VGVGVGTELGLALGFGFGFGFGLGSGVGPGFEGCGLLPSRSPTLKQPTSTSGYQLPSPHVLEVRLVDRPGSGLGLGVGVIGLGVGVIGLGLGKWLGGQAGRQASWGAAGPISPNPNP